MVQYDSNCKEPSKVFYKVNSDVLILGLFLYKKIHFKCINHRFSTASDINQKYWIQAKCMLSYLKKEGSYEIYRVSSFLFLVYDDI